MRQVVLKHDALSAHLDEPPVRVLLKVLLHRRQMQVRLVGKTVCTQNCSLACATSEIERHVVILGPNCLEAPRSVGRPQRPFTP